MEKKKKFNPPDLVPLQPEQEVQKALDVAENRLNKKVIAQFHRDTNVILKKIGEAQKKREKQK